MKKLFFILLLLVPAISRAQGRLLPQIGGNKDTVHVASLKIDTNATIKNKRILTVGDSLTGSILTTLMHNSLGDSIKLNIGGAVLDRDNPLNSGMYLGNNLANLIGRFYNTVNQVTNYPITLVGNSQVAQSYRYEQPIKQILGSTYQISGPGYLSGSFTAYGLNSYTSTPTAANWIQRAYTTSPMGTGADMFSLISQGSSTDWGWTFTDATHNYNQYTDITVFWYGRTGGGTFTVTVDGVLQATINTSSALGLQSTAISGLSQTVNHQVLIHITSHGSAECEISGFNLTNNSNKGFVINRVGASGTKSEDYLNADSTTQATILKTFSPGTFIIELNVNDRVSGITPTAFKAYLDRLIHRVKAVDSTNDIVLLGSTDVDTVAHPGLVNVGLYNDIDRQLALKDTCAFFDEQKVIPNYVYGNLRGDYDDGIHLSGNGGYTICKALLNSLGLYYTKPVAITDIPTLPYWGTSAGTSVTTTNAVVGTSNSKALRIVASGTLAMYVDPTGKVFHGGDTVDNGSGSKDQFKELSVDDHNGNQKIGTQAGVLCAVTNTGNTFIGTGVASNSADGVNKIGNDNTDVGFFSLRIAGITTARTCSFGSNCAYADTASDWVIAGYEAASNTPAFGTPASVLFGTKSCWNLSGSNPNLTVSGAFNFNSATSLTNVTATGERVGYNMTSCTNCILETDGSGTSPTTSGTNYYERYLNGAIREHYANGLMVQDGADSVGSNFSVHNKIINYNGIPTVGNGVPAIYGYAKSSIGQTGAITVTSYTPAADGVFRVGGFLSVAAITTDVIKYIVSYTNERGVSVVSLPFYPQGTTSPNIAVIGEYAYPTMDIWVQGGTTITLSTTLVTGTGTINYDVTGSIMQIGQ